MFVSVLAPSLRRMSPASRGEFTLSVLPSYMRFIGGSSIAAAVAGLALYAYITQVATSLAPSGSGLIYIQIGAVVTLIVLLIAFGVLIPSPDTHFDDCRRQHLTPGSQRSSSGVGGSEKLAESLAATPADDEPLLSVIE